MPRPFTTENAAEYGAKGGRKSGEVRRAKRDLRQELQALLDSGDRAERLCLALYDKAVEGDPRAFAEIRKVLIGDSVSVSDERKPYSELDESEKRDLKSALHDAWSLDAIEGAVTDVIRGEKG